MVKDHTRLNTELGSVAKSIGLTVPADLSADQQREYTNLSKLSGKTFDKQYIELMVNDHTEDLAAFRKAESDVQNPKAKKGDFLRNSCHSGAFEYGQGRRNQSGGSLETRGGGRRVGVSANRDRYL